LIPEPPPALLRNIKVCVIPPVLRIVSLVVFASTLFTRAVDPVVPKIANDLGIAVTTAALLSTAFTFPYAIMQPVLGVVGDFFGKTRLMNISLAIVVVTTLVCAFASNFSVLVAMRILAGMLAGGIFPVGIAIVADLVPFEQRQVAIGRLLAVVERHAALPRHRRLGAGDALQLDVIRLAHLVLRMHERVRQIAVIGADQ